MQLRVRYMTFTQKGTYSVGQRSCHQTPVVTRRRRPQDKGPHINSLMTLGELLEVDSRRAMCYKQSAALALPHYKVYRIAHPFPLLPPRGRQSQWECSSEAGTQGGKRGKTQRWYMQTRRTLPSSISRIISSLKRNSFTWQVFCLQRCCLLQSNVVIIAFQRVPFSLELTPQNLQ